MSVDAKSRELDSTVRERQEYVLYVKYVRPIGEDLEVIAAKPEFDGVPVGESLKRQLVQELQEAADEVGVNGFFEVVGGPFIQV